MASLLDYCALVRSKNAGPFTLTFDFMCRDRRTFDALVAAKVLTPELFATMYGADVGEVRLVEHERALAIKVSLPRPVIQGAVADMDSYAGQQYAPLMELSLPELPRSTDGPA